MTAPAFSRVLVGWDGSESAARGFAAACRIAPEDGEVLALAVVSSYGHLETDDERDLAIAKSRDPLTRCYEEVVATMPDRGPRRLSLEFLESDHAAESLVGYANEHAFDLIVLGLHGNEGELHHKVGHVAAHVVKTGRCPLLLLPKEGASTIARPVESSRLGGIKESLLHPFARHPTTPR